VSDPRAEAREQIARAIYDGVIGQWLPSHVRDTLAANMDPRPIADAVLATPAVAAAFDAADKVRALADEWLCPADHTSHYRDGLRDAARAIHLTLGDRP
jgi:hypothetical protein